MKKKHLLPIIISVFLALLVSWLIGTCITSKPEHQITDLDNRWTVSLNGDKPQDVKLTEFYKFLGDRDLLQGDVLLLSTTLPYCDEPVTPPFPILFFRSRYTTLECYLDGEEIYSFALDMYEKKQFIGKMYHFITLPMNYEGKTFTMKMTVGENDAFNALAPVQLGSQPDIESRFINEHMMIIATGMFLIIFGVAFMCITLSYVFSTPDILNLLLGSIFCMNLGAWVLCYYNVLSLFFYTRLETQIEYFTLYLIVPYCYLLLYHIQKIENKRLYLIAAYTSSFLTLIQYILHYGFNIHLRATLPLYHIVAIFGFGVIIFYTVRNLRRKDISPSGMIQMTGLISFAAAEVVHLIIYQLGNLHIPYSDFLALVALDSGCLIFVMCQLANYLLFVTQSYAQRKEHASLTHLAYADGLTNMANRARADKLLEDLDRAETDYCIISVDLNGLKYVNDKYGHLAGDKYIKDFSKVLYTTFSDDGYCARIGGDEFLVIIPDSTDKDIEAMIGRMTSALNVMNAIYSEYSRSAAAGYAFRHECPPGAKTHEVYLLADERMYEVKRKMHEELGIKNRL